MPANLLGDFGGGSTYLVMGVLAALVAVRSGGPGQVVDAAIVDGVASLSGFVHGLRGAGAWPGSRGENLLDGGAPVLRRLRLRRKAVSWPSARSSRSSTPSWSGCPASR